MKIQICIGSACHLRGSQEVIQKMYELCKQYNVEADVELGGSFCMGACSGGVSMRIDGGEIYHIKPEHVEVFFVEEVMGRLA
ncbi:(2Fe-2S) ferredoxin domain-containing protein [Lachnospiraceae bacterium LCP25S3_G4]